MESKQKSLQTQQKLQEKLTARPKKLMFNKILHVPKWGRPWHILRNRLLLGFFWGPGYVFSEIPRTKKTAPGEEVDRSIAGFPGYQPARNRQTGVSAGVALREDRKSP